MYISAMFYHLCREQHQDYHTRLHWIVDFPKPLGLIANLLADGYSDQNIADILHQSLESVADWKERLRKALRPQASQLQHTQSEPLERTISSGNLPLRC